MSAPIDLGIASPVDVPSGGLLGAVQGVVSRVNDILIAFCAIAIGAAGCVLTWEVAGRYFLKIPSDWQDELAVFLLVGASFCSAAWIQARRGHIGINALQQILPPAIDRWRRVLVDAASCLFCAFFCWKCGELLSEAIEDGQISGSPWGPPLWIPYGLMTLGMTALAIQLALQLLKTIGGAAAR